MHYSMIYYTILSHITYIACDGARGWLAAIACFRKGSTWSPAPILLH